MHRPRRRTAIILLITTLLASTASSAFAENEGQADFDKATSLKFNAESMVDLERVVELCESAIEKGLDPDSAKLAKALITATLFQHGSRFAQVLFDPRERPQRPAMLQQFALRDLYKVLKYDDTLPQVHMMVARLEAVDSTGRGIQQTSFDKGKASAVKAVELLEKSDDKPLLSKALILRAGYLRGEEQANDISRAIEVDPNNLDAWRLRGKSRLVEGEFLAAKGQLDKAKVAREKAISDFTNLLEKNPDDGEALQAVAELLGRLGNFEEALAKANQAIEQNPDSSNLYRMRARLYRMTKEYEKGIEDLDQAIDIQPDSFMAFLDRSDVNYDKGDKEAAAKDFGKARELEPAITDVILQGISIRSEGKREKANKELKKMIEIDDLRAQQEESPLEAAFRLQLAINYVGSDDPGTAIQVLSELIEKLDDKADRVMFLALRTRADAYLSTGGHKNAIADYQSARKIRPKDQDVLNNLAWVLATSPNDKLRNGGLAVEIAEKACEESKFGEAHILSTLAAAHAEAGDFEKAIEWSSKAVKLNSVSKKPSAAETQKQLEDELDSYKGSKPWRELQDLTKEQDEVNEETKEVASNEEEKEAVGAN